MNEWKQYKKEIACGFVVGCLVGWPIGRYLGHKIIKLKEKL